MSREAKTIACTCGREVVLHTWWSNTCAGCGTDYNGSGQRLRTGWRDNASLYDEDVSDMEGFEVAELRRSGEL